MCRNSRQERKELKWIKFIATTTNELLTILICKLWVKNNYLERTNIPMSSKKEYGEKNSSKTFRSDLKL